MNRRRLLVLSSVILAAGPLAGAKGQDAPRPFTSEQLDQMLAPIALYPDALLAQVLMAATYPIRRGRLRRLAATVSIVQIFIVRGLGFAG